MEFWVIIKIMKKGKIQRILEKVEICMFIRYFRVADGEECSQKQKLQKREKQQLRLGDSIPL